MHEGTRAWHYGLNFENNKHTSSLSTYLGLTREEYKDMLVICNMWSGSKENQAKYEYKGSSVE